jgi:hypothetical protein
VTARGGLWHCIDDVKRTVSLMEHRTPGRSYPLSVSVAENPQGSNRLTAVSPKEALRRARPLPSDNDMAVEGLTDKEWDAFEQALADR